jgi:hypothetical protein
MGRDERKTGEAKSEEKEGPLGGEGSRVAMIAGSEGKNRGRKTGWIR